MPLIPVLADIERAGIASTARRSPRSRTQSSRNSRLQRADLRAGRRGVQHQLAEAALRDAVRQAAAAGAEEDRQDASARRRPWRCSRSSRSAHELPRLILEWRALQKLKGTYIDALPQLVNPETGRVHTCFNQAVAATGRLSSSDPNLQNIPIRTELGREIRRAFVAERGPRADLGRLLADRAARARASLRRRGAHRGVPPGDGHPRSNRAEGVRRRQRARRARAAAPGEDHQLRAALRKDRLHAGEGHRRPSAGRAGVHQRLLRGLSVASASSSTTCWRKPGAPAW